MPGGGRARLRPAGDQSLPEPPDGVARPSSVAIIGCASASVSPAVPEYGSHPRRVERGSGARFQQRNVNCPQLNGPGRCIGGTTLERALLEKRNSARVEEVMGHGQEMVRKVGLAATTGAAIVALSSAPAAASTCPAPGTGLPGALNMIADATVLTVPMVHDAAQGNTGMNTAVSNSGC